MANYFAQAILRLNPQFLISTQNLAFLSAFIAMALTPAQTAAHAIAAQESK
ncbi:hypothetical protein MCOR15_004324 [Pyricularia oryzae]|nr:hypothetical protein MCOR15_004324 [Pyricularia oryzae]